MHRNPERARPRSSNRVSQPSRWRFFYLTLIVIVGLGSAKPNAAALAAPPKDETDISFDISTSPIPNPACAHTSYDVEFFTRVDTVANLNGNPVDLQGGPGPSEIEVQAKSSDSSVAGFHPETATATALDGRIGKGAKFVLRTEEPGSATLTMTGKITWANKRVIFPPLQQPIKVVNCRFKITINSTSAGFIPNVMETAVYNLTGEIKGDPGGALTGDSEVNWKTQQVGDCYVTKQAVLPSTANLEGSLSEDGDRLTVRVTFGPVSVLNSLKWTCGGAAGATAEFTFQPTPINFVVPTTGGVVSQPVTIPIGVLTLTGSAIITVVPLEAN